MLNIHVKIFDVQKILLLNFKINGAAEEQLIRAIIIHVIFNMKYLKMFLFLIFVKFHKIQQFK